MVLRDDARQRSYIQGGAWSLCANPEVASRLDSRVSTSRCRPLRKPGLARASCLRSWQSSSAGVSRPARSPLAPPAAEHAFGRHCARPFSAGSIMKALVPTNGRGAPSPGGAGVSGRRQCTLPTRPYHNSEVGCARHASSRGSISQPRLLRCASADGALTMLRTSAGSRSASRAARSRRPGTISPADCPLRARRRRVPRLLFRAADERARGGVDAREGWRRGRGA